MPRKILALACLFIGMLLLAKYWVDFIVYNRSFDVYFNQGLWESFGSDIDYMMVTALALGLAMLVVAVLLWLNGTSIMTGIALAVLLITGWHEWQQDTIPPNISVLGGSMGVHVQRLDMLLGPKRVHLFSPYSRYQNGIRIALAILVPVGLGLCVAELSRQTRPVHYRNASRSTPA